MQQHIPAWKRLGLKLKYARDSSHAPYQNAESEISRASNDNHELNATTTSNGLSDLTPPPKKRKLSPDPAASQRTDGSRIKANRRSKPEAVDNSISDGYVEEKKAEQPGW